MAKKKEQKKSSPPPKPKKKREFRTAEFMAILALFMGIFVLLSLISYYPSDPSWATDSTSVLKASNFMGRIGASCSEALFQIFGLAAFIIPLALFYSGIRIFLPHHEAHLVRKIAGTGFLLVAFSALFHLFWGDLAWRSATIQAGGLLGDGTASFLIQYLNHVGSILVLIAGLVLFLIFSTHVSLPAIVHFLGRMFHFFFKELRIRIVHYQKEKTKKKMRRRVIEKYAPPQSEADEGKVNPAKATLKPLKINKRHAAKIKEPVKISQPEPTEKLLFPELDEKGDYTFPPLSLLDPGKEAEKIDKNELYEKKQIIEEKFLQFKVEGEVREYHPGPIITTYEYYPHPHIKVSQVVNLSEDLSLALGAESVRMQRIPGKSSIGIEIPNNKQEIIKLRDVIQTEKFIKSPSKLTIALGKTIHGEPYITDLSVMPHLLIAGATGTGKSVCLNTIISSILYKASPEEVKLILIDPKRIEFSLYDGIPHLLCPVVKDSRKAEAILLDAIKKMEDRYQTLGYLKVRNIEQYNQQVKKLLSEKGDSLTDEEKEKLQPLPYIVIIIDELAELMMVGAKEVEYCIARLAQLARAVGIHLVMATQRPSTDVITGTIKNNFSSRIAFRVPSKIDSRVIIDQSGADKLLGRGDMLFMPPNFPRILRLHSSFVSLAEVTRLLNFVKEQGKPNYDETIIKVLKSPAGHVEDDTGERDPIFEKAVELVLLTGQASASYLQRKLKLGYARASRILDQMESEGIVGPTEGSKPREILIDPETWLRQQE